MISPFFVIYFFLTKSYNGPLTMIHTTVYVRSIGINIIRKVGKSFSKAIKIELDIDKYKISWFICR